MKTTPVLFVGYKTIDQWLLVIDRSKPVFASLATEPGEAAQYNLRTDQLVIVIAQPEDDLVHYFRTVVAQLRYLDGEPFDVDHKRRIVSANEAWQKVQDWLQDQKLIYRQGVIASPKDLRFLDGDTSGLL
jgi:hypothetical protein